MSPRIAIIGAGPGGLTLACILVRHSIIPTVFEREPSPDSRLQGGSLDLHTHSGQQALRDAGLWDQFMKHARYDAQTMKVLVKSGDVVYEDAASEESDNGSRPEIDRTALCNILLESFGVNNVNWDHALASVEPSGDNKHDLHFKDGKVEAGFDLVVGADGAWSRVRPRVTPVVPFYSGVSMIEVDISDTTGPRYDFINDLVGKGSAFVYSDQKGITAQRQGTGAIRVHASLAMSEVTPDWLNSTFDAKDPVATKAKTLAYYEDWDPRLQDLIKLGDDSIVLRSLYMLPLDHTWEPCPGVTLLGDAAHLMTPYAGEGVNITMWDSLELAKKIVEGIKTRELDRAVREYEVDMFKRAAASKGRTQRNKIGFFSKDFPMSMAAAAQERRDGLESQGKN